jgi:hypothetical protein
MISLAQYLKARGMRPRQVQDFIPTPMSMATCMHVTGIDPLTMTDVRTVTDLREKKLHKALLLYWDEAQQDLTREALEKAGRRDLIGNGPRALVPPAPRRLRGFAHPTPAAPGQKTTSRTPRRTSREALRGRR